MRNSTWMRCTGALALVTALTQGCNVVEVSEPEATDRAVDVYRVTADDVRRLDADDRLIVSVPPAGEAVLVDPSRGAVDFGRIDIADDDGRLVRADTWIVHLADVRGVDVADISGSELVIATEPSDALEAMEMPIAEIDEFATDYELRRGCVTAGDGCCDTGICCLFSYDCVSDEETGWFSCFCAAWGCCLEA